MTAIKTQKHFSIRRLPDGGIALIGKFAHGEFAVKLTGKEVETIKRHVIALHKKLHGQNGMSGAAPILRHKIKSAVIGCLRRRFNKHAARQGFMGAATNRPVARPPAKRPVMKKPPAKPPVKPVVRPAVVRPAVVRPAVDADLRNKIQVVSKGLALTSQNRSRFLSGPRRAPTPQELAQGRAYASKGFIRLGLPGNLKPHPFYQGKPVPMVADLVAKAVNQLKQAPKGAQPGARPATASAPKTKGTQPLKPKPAQMKPVLAGIKVLTIRRAAMLAYEARKQTKPTPDELKRGQAFAHQLYLRDGIPTTDAPSTFWRHPVPFINRKVQALVESATKLGAPKKVPLAPVDGSKLQVLRKGISTIATRRAKFLAQQRLSPADVTQGRNAPVTQPDMRAGTQFAKAFFTKNGVPSPDGNHVFWTQPIEQIATRVAAVVKMAEVQGAPPAKPKAKMPAKPVKTNVAPSKVEAVTQGLKLVSDRRAKFLAHHRQAAVPSEIDIRDGKDFAKKFFTENNIPVRLPGKNESIIGWAARERHHMGEVSAAPPEVDPVTTFWARPLEVIQRQVAELVVKARENGAPLEPTGKPVSLDPDPGQGGGGGAPGDVPQGEVPGEMPPGGEVPGEVPPGGEIPGEEPPGEIPGQEPTGQIPGEQYQPPYGEPEVPGQMPYDYAQTEEAPGQMEDVSYQETSYTDEPVQVPGEYADPNAYDAAAPSETDAYASNEADAYATAETESYATEEYASNEADAYATAETESYATEEYAANEYAANESSEADPELYLDAPEENFDTAVSGVFMRRRYR